MIIILIIRLILDMSGVTLGHALQMTPTIIKRAVASWENYPVRIQQLQFVNANIGINIMLDLFRSFMSHKMKSRISVCRNKPEFKATDNLPEELGGTNGNYAKLAKYWKKVLEQNHKWFIDDDYFKSSLG